MDKTNNWFTLVELIVVITILAVLATVWFISFQWYSSLSRDSLRLSDIKSIQKWFNLKLTQSEPLPLPNNPVNISGSGQVFYHQWYAGKKVLDTIWVFWEVMDPSDNLYYTYSTNVARNKYQIIGYFENKNTQNSFVYKNMYADFSQRNIRTFWNNLGIIINKEKFSPIQKEQKDIDIVLDEKSLYSIVYENIPLDITAELQKSFQFSNSSCKSILDTWLSNGNGIYEITNNSKTYNVYCDMKDWGFTGLISVNSKGKTWKFNSTEWINPTVKENTFLTQETTYNSYENLTTNEIKLCRWDLNHCYTMTHNQNIPLQDFYEQDITYIDFSRHIKRLDLSEDHYYNTQGPDDIWTDNKQKYFDNLWIQDDIHPQLNKYWLWINIYHENKLWFQADNNNRWPTFDNQWAWIWVFGSYSCWWDWEKIDINRAYSVSLANQCVYENPDTEMWFVLWK